MVKPAAAAKTADVARPAVAAKPAAVAAPAPVVRPTPIVNPAAVAKPVLAPKPKPAAPAHQVAARTQVAHSTVARSSAATAPTLEPIVETVPDAPVPEAPKPVREPSAPLVIIRRPAAKVGAAPPAARAVAPAPAKPASLPKPAPKAKPAEVPTAPVEQKKEKKKSRKDRKQPHKVAKKRERKHRRHSKRVKRRAASLDLKDGERVSLSIEGWSRLRRATLVVTNYRVALITQLPPLVKWIPLEEVATIHRRWHGAHSIVVGAPTEVLTLQKAKRQMIASFQELLESEVAEARRGGFLRHHADITQEWCERATQVWDSRYQRLRLWIRRHPTVTLTTGLFLTVGAYFLSSALTSFFSPVR
jgi:hypothetical protein